MRRLAAVLAVALLAACSPEVKDGYYACGSGGECPDGLHCVAERCWRGSGPADAGPGLPADAGQVADGGDVDAGCLVDTDCADGVACTADACMPEGCRNTPDPELCLMGEMCDPTRGCVPLGCDDTCRADPASCVVSAVCEGTTCRRTMCDPMTQVCALGMGCVHCGALDEPCCMGTSDTGGCGASTLACNSGTNRCVPCGNAIGAPCCVLAGGTGMCNPGLHCSASICCEDGSGICTS